MGMSENEHKLLEIRGSTNEQLPKIKNSIDNIEQSCVEPDCHFC